MRAIFEPSTLTTTLRRTPPLPSMSVPVWIVTDCAAHKLAQANKHNFIKPRNSGRRRVSAPGERLYGSRASPPAGFDFLAFYCNAAIGIPVPPVSPSALADAQPRTAQVGRRCPSNLRVAAGAEADR